ncbi:MAG: nucleotidyltransferase family protein [Bryobacteraceae bacterium]
MNPAAVILAAGASTRMGSPKALLLLDGETFLDRLIGLFGARCRPVVAVLGYHAEAIEAGIRRGGEALVVRNPDPARGQASSLQTGIAALGESVQDFFFCPVDAPAVAPATIDALIDRWAGRKPGEWIFRPRTRLAGVDASSPEPAGQWRRGHPVLVSGPVRGQLMALGRDASIRDLLRAHPDRTVMVDVDDAGILGDIDHPEQYRILTSQRADPRR